VSCEPNNHFATADDHDVDLHLFTAAVDDRGFG
jgi:hypothetical protein